MLVKPLDLQSPIAAFNGGLLVNPDLTVIEQRTIPHDLVVPIAKLMATFGLGVWVYRGGVRSGAPSPARPERRSAGSRSARLHKIRKTL